MAGSAINPFTDPERRQLWVICVQRDIEAFLAQNWNHCGDDFLAEGFVGLDARFHADPAQWRLTFPTLESYRLAWEQQSREFAAGKPAEDAPGKLYSAMQLDPILIEGDHALIYKKFDGCVNMRDGQALPLHWQSLFFAQRHKGVWKLRGFVGYLPYPWPKIAS